MMKMTPLSAEQNERKTEKTPPSLIGQGEWKFGNSAEHNRYHKKLYEEYKYHDKSPERNKERSCYGHERKGYPSRGRGSPVQQKKSVSCSSNSSMYFPECNNIWATEQAKGINTRKDLPGLEKEILSC